jgi:hypothetical protein
VLDDVTGESDSPTTTGRKYALATEMWAYIKKVARDRSLKPESARSKSSLIRGRRA